MESKEKQKRMLKKYLETGLYVFLAVAVIYFVLNFVGQRTSVSGDSMYPSLKNGDQLILEKLSYRFGEPERFDVIVFDHYEEGSDTPVHYIKRIIGLPGETICIKDGNIYVDGERLTETYGYYTGDREMEGYDAEEEILVGEDEYFVLGDNRNNSLDSRRIGCIRENDILGKAVFRLYPFSEIGFFD